ncbi:MAG: DUF4340 domain-containing protein [Gammaproteobacteria bacterium]
MSKINLLNLVLFIAVITLAFFIYFSEEESFELERLSDADINSISKIIIKHNTNTTTIVKQQSDKWQITQPISIAANNFRLSSILKLINAPVHNKYALSEIDASSLGLDKPATTIQFDDESTTYGISFGITNPATNLRYIRMNDSIYTIEDVYYPFLSSNFSTLVSLHLLPDNSTIEKLVLSNQTISKNDKGLWQSNIDISADNINITIDYWKDTQAFGIHQYLKRDNLGEVFIYLSGQQEPVTFVITDTDPWLILARPELGLEYHLDVEAYNNLIAPQ